MNRILGAALAATAIIGAGSAQAQTSPEAFIKAGEDLAAAVQSGQPPRLSDPAAAPGILAAYDLSVLDGAAQLPLHEILPLCATPIRSMMGYLLFGLTPADLQGNPSEAVVRQMNDNAVRYQDEAALALRFSIRCNSLTLKTASDFIAALPEADRTPPRRAGVRQSRAGALQAYTGVLTMAVEPTTKASNRDLVLDEAVAEAEAYAALMTLDQRRELTAQIDALLPRARVASVRTRFQQIRAAMARTDCGTLCAF